MDFTSFIKWLAPTFERDQVIEKSKLTAVSLHETVIPSYKQAAELLRGWKFKSAQVNAYFKEFSEETGEGKAFIQAVYAKLPQVVENLYDVQELIQKAFDEDIASLGLTYSKATLIQFVTVCDFFTKYSLKFLHYIYVMEAAEYEMNDIELSEALTKAQIDWVVSNFPNYCLAFNAVTNHKGVFSKALKEVPDITITGDNEKTLSHTVGLRKLDPLGMRFISANWNPFVWIGERWVEHEHKNYVSMKSEQKSLQLRVLYLKRLAEGKTDAALEKQIRHYEGEVQKLGAEIADYEAKANR
jgi:hypothetical protein